MGILDYSTTPGSNTTINGIGISGGSSIKYGNDAIMQFMADMKSAVTKAADKTAGTYTAAKADHNQLWRVTGNATINLTAAATLTAGWALWVMADGGTATIDPAGSEKINGADTLVLATGNSAFIVCTGTAFRAIIFNAAATLGDAAYLNVGTTAGTVAAGDDSRIVGAVQSGRKVDTQYSLTGGGDLSADRTLSLVGDTASPGNDKVYGTDGAGARGWRDAPTPDFGAGNAALALGAVGTYAFMATGGTGAVAAGGTVAGSSLSYSNANASSPDPSASGTWRCLGKVPASTSGAENRTTLYLRIS